MKRHMGWIVALRIVLIATCLLIAIFLSQLPEESDSLKASDDQTQQVDLGE